MASLGNLLQENLLVLLTFDDVQAKIIRNSVDHTLFGGVYATIAQRIYEFIDKHQAAPREHLPDLLEDKLGEGRESRMYEEVLDNIADMRDGINPGYVIGQLETFVKRQSLRSVAVDFAKLLNKDDEASLDAAEELLKKVNSARLKVFDPGLRLSDPRSLAFLDIEADIFKTGIPELDKRGFGPTRKELSLYLAATKKGKSWWLIHLAKIAALLHLRVLHITLELSEERNAQRYYQTFFNMAKHGGYQKRHGFERDSLGRVKGLQEYEFKPKLALDDPDIGKKLEEKRAQFASRLLKNIIIKQFPTGKLTVRKLEAFMDNLELTHKFVPDLLIIDYPDLMEIDTGNYRFSLDEIYKGIRGMSVERNMAAAAVSQTNRGAHKSKNVGVEQVGEAYSKIQHADLAITYSQTAAEKALGLARLTVGAGRNDADGITIVVAQDYGTGQFVTDSNLLVGDYWESLKAETSEGDEDDQ